MQSVHPRPVEHLGQVVGRRHVGSEVSPIVYLPVPDGLAERSVEPVHGPGTLSGPAGGGHPQHPPSPIVGLPVALRELVVVVPLFIKNRQVDETPADGQPPKLGDSTQPSRRLPGERADRIPEEFDVRRVFRQFGGLLIS